MFTCASMLFFFIATLGQTSKPASPSTPLCIVPPPRVKPLGVAPPCPTSITKLRGYSADDGLTVDIMAVYTPAARDAAGGVAQIESHIDQAVTIANQAMANSLIDTRLRVIRKALIQYTESGDGVVDLNRLVATNDGFLDSVHADRDTYGADIVSLWVATLNAGGTAYELSGLDGDDDGAAGFNVIRQDAYVNETLAHELGHNFGCNHDRANAQGVPFRFYGYGYREPGNLWHDIMAYPPGEAILYYSNPNITYTGPLGDPGPIGVPGNDPNTASDCARLIRETSFTVANFRPSALTVTPPARLYVKSPGPANGDGSTWANAMPDLQLAIGKAAAAHGIVNEIWVAAGTYKPDRGRNDPYMSFRPVEGVNIYGGFAGTETLFSQRNITTNETILSGDIGTSGNVFDNSYHVVNTVDLNDSAVLDGFTITQGYAYGDYPHESGGGLYARCGMPTIRNCTFRQNSALDIGGAAEIFGSQGPHFISCTFFNNDATYGGAVHAGTGTTPTFDNCAFNSNDAFSSGGALRTDGASPTFTGCTFFDNRGDNSGGAEVVSGAPTFTLCTFSANIADYGGGLAFYQSVGSAVTHCTFEFNASAAGGGAGLLAGDNSGLSITGCAFNQNTAGFGAGMYCYGQSNPSIDQTTFTGNIAQYGGAAIDNYNAAPTLTNCTFTSNIAGDTGSGSGVGGAVENDNISNASFTDCTFTQNTAGCCGGSVFNSSGTSTFLNRCTFLANNANYGAAIWSADIGSNPTNINCKFLGNTAQFGGGAIHTTGGTSPFYIGCVFSGNTVPQGYGGVADNRDSSPAFINCTMSGNSAAFGVGALSNDASTSVVTNCIIWNNTDPNGNGAASELVPVNGGGFTVSYSIIQGGFTGTGNLSTDPLLADIDGPDNALGTLDDNLRVTLGSPAIDSANRAALTTIVFEDVARAVRLIDDPTPNTGVGNPTYLDRGAYEFIRAIPGDINCDGVTNASDVPIFIAAVLDGTPYIFCDRLRADFNADGEVDGADINAFVHQLLP